MMAPAREVFLFVDAFCADRGTVKSVRDKGIGGVGDNVRLLLRLGDGKACQRQNDADHDYNQADYDTQIKEGGL